MSSNIAAMHDKIFKQSMTDKAIAQHFFSHHLPDWMKRIVKLTKLELRPGSFVNNKLQAYYTDLLYEVPIADQPGYLYLLAEHKSYPSRFLSLQLLEYMCQIWRQHLKDHSGSTSLPLIYPVTFYHGRTSPYPYSSDLLDCFSSPDLARRILHTPWHIIDITVIPDEEIKQHEKAALFQLSQKYIFQNDFLPMMKDLVKSGLLEQFEKNHRHHLLEVIKYLIECGEAEDSDELIDILVDTLPNERGEIMTVAQQLKEIGKLEGKLEGKQQEKQMIARNLLIEGADVAFVAKVTGLSLPQVRAIVEDSATV